MKKAELKQGVPYYINSRSEMPSNWGKSVARIHEQSQGDMYYIVFQDGKPYSYSRNPSSVYVTRCKDRGANCPKHPAGSKWRCSYEEVRLMDIRGEYWELIKQARERYLAQPVRDIRAERLARIAKRQKQDYEEPIKKEFYKVMREFTGSYVSEYDQMRHLSVEQMQAIATALKAHLPAKEVA